MKFSDFKKKLETSDIAKAPGESYERIKNLEVILDIVKTVNRSLILDDVLELVLRNSINLTNTERGFIVLKDKSGGLEYKIGIDNQGNQLPESSFNISTSVIHDVFNSGQSKFIEAAQSDSDYDSSKSIFRLELQTILCSPLITEDKKIGVIYVDSKHLHKIKIREITDTFEILAGQAATAILNAQLYKGQIAAYHALNEANIQLIQIERKALKSSIDSEIGQSLQGLVHLALLETESMMRTLEKSQKELESKYSDEETIVFDRLKLKAKVAIDSIRNIQKYAQALLETSFTNLVKDSGDLNKTIQSVIKYLSPMKKFHKINFSTELNALPVCRYDSEQIQHLMVQLFTNSAEAKTDANIFVRTSHSGGNIIVEVHDDGPGIPKDKLGILFEIPSENKTGYGLFLCKNIIDKHNGFIKVADNEEGAAIQFSIPVS
jgi:signal transduction histidine kinase